VLKTTQARLQLLSRILRWLVLSIVAAWLVGAILFVSADGSLECTLPRLAAPPDDEHDLALYRWGPTLRVSSYHRDVDAHHHPAFLVDGHDRPELLEKWASAKGDRKPWVEILWREPRTLSRVVIRHAGWQEDEELTAQRYRISCLGPDKPPPPIAVQGNEQPVRTHPLTCAGARGIRIDWKLNPDGELVRVFEIEAWGR
jgi:hypothetical protein